MIIYYVYSLGKQAFEEELELDSEDLSDPRHVFVNANQVQEEWKARKNLVESYADADAVLAQMGVTCNYCFNEFPEHVLYGGKKQCLGGSEECVLAGVCQKCAVGYMKFAAGVRGPEKALDVGQFCCGQCHSFDSDLAINVLAAWGGLTSENAGDAAGGAGYRLFFKW